MNSAFSFFAGSRSFLSLRHPLLKLLIGFGLLATFLVLPDRSLTVVAGKGAVLILLWFCTGGPARWRSLFRILLLLLGFLVVLFLCTVLGAAVSKGADRGWFRMMALKSVWIVSISFLIGGAVHFRECVYLTRVLKVPPGISSQVLLIFLIWGKLFGEFRRVSLAWRSRGITPRFLKRHPALIAGLLKIILLRVVLQASRLELALPSRGFTGRLYSCFTASWTVIDSLTLIGLGFLIYLLIVMETGSI